MWWNAEGRQLRAIGADGRLTVRDAATGRLTIEPAALDEPPVAVVPDSAGRLVGSAHAARLWDAETGKPAGPLMPCPQSARDIALSADGRRAAILTSEQVLLCDPVTGAMQHTLNHAGALRCVLAGDGVRLATITREAVQLWDVNTGRLVGQPIAAGGNGTTLPRASTRPAGASWYGGLHPRSPAKFESSPPTLAAI